MKNQIKKLGIILVIMTTFSVPFLTYGTGIHDAYTNPVVTGLDDSSVKLNGSAKLTTTPVSGYFRYSTATIPPIFCNDNFGDDMKSTNEVPLGTSTIGAVATFSSDIYGLDGGTTYYYCAVASDKTIIEYGNVGSFTTLPYPNALSFLHPVIKTKPATSINSNSARLNGSYNTIVDAGTWFEYRQKPPLKDKFNNEINPIPVLGNLVDTSTMSTNKQTQISGQSVPVNISIPYVYDSANPYKWSNKLNYQTHLAQTNGDINYLLKNLKKNTSYEFRAGVQSTTGGIIGTPYYGDILTFRTSTSDVSTSSNDGNLNLGQTATPPDDAIVRWHEGIETVFARQLTNNTELAHIYGYVEGMDLNIFAWDTADFLARTFGYVSSNKKEIRVSKPDIAAYQLSYKTGKLTVYEYYNSKIVAIQNITSSLRSKYYYEYYFVKK
jgi:hypothetical protein